MIPNRTLRFRLQIRKKHETQRSAYSFALSPSLCLSFVFHPAVFLELDLPAGVHNWALAEQLLELCRDRQRSPADALIQHVDKTKCPANGQKRLRLLYTCFSLFLGEY